jgi:ABC-type transport system involved in cytochrome c biogenesis permease subunit
MQSRDDWSRNASSTATTGRGFVRLCEEMMSVSTMPLTRVVDERKVAATVGALELADAAMRGLASLKLTVGLFAYGIFVVYLGTTAQQEADIWQVVRDYFHAWVMWVDVNLLFPRSFFSFMPHFAVPRFPLPGGMVVGSLMAINLLAAHGWRFKVQARGLRLWLGVIVTLVGIAVGVLIVWSGHNSGGFQTKPPFSWGTFWTSFLSGSALLWLVAAAAFGRYGVMHVFESYKARAVPWIEVVLTVIVGLLVVALGGLVAWGFLAERQPSGEALRVVWQLIQGGLAGLILLVGCVMVFRKRGGMVLLHLGIGLLMFNELWVASTARERQVFMQEGQTVNYLRDIRTVELAIVDRSAEKTDEHIVIPRDMLVANYEQNRSLVKAGKEPRFIDNPVLPVKVAVLEYYRNADVRDVAGEKNLATTGRGLKEALVERPAATGTDTDGGVDLAGAYMRFASKDGKDLGTFMLSQLASEQKFPERFAEKLSAGDVTYDLFLRFKREYKPYTLSLVDVRKDDYLASDTPRNYSSDVKIVDPESGVDEQVHIKMNDPLRYRGDTLYQSGYHKLPDGEATTLQVVRNRGWMIPYVACMVVVIGMVAHFLISVTRFVGRREAEELASGDVIKADLAKESGSSTKGKRKAERKATATAGRGFDWSTIGLPLFAAGVFFLIAGSAIRPPRAKPEAMDLVRFGQLPVAHMGRIKPLDSLARTTVRTLTINSESARLASGERVPATQWLLEVMSGTDASLEMPIIRIDSKEVRRIFELPDRKGFAYAVKELQPKIGEFEKQVEAAQKTEEDKRTVEQRRVLELDERLKLYITIVRAFSPPDLPKLPSEDEIKNSPSAIQQYMAEFRSALQGATRMMTAMKAPRLIPIELGEDTKPEDAWQPYPVAYALATFMQLSGQEPDGKTIAFNSIISAYHKQDVAAFNTAVARYESLLERANPPLLDQTRVDQEAYFNHVSPFFVGMILYVIGFTIALLGCLFRYRPLNWAAFTLIGLTFLFHTAALVLRIYISGRPPVTNLYSSAIFIGWGAVMLGLVIEAIFRIGIGNIVGAAAGFSALLIAYFLAAGGDTIAVLQAVLDTQFWLATHVVCITYGYVATFVAGLCGLAFVVLGWITPAMDRDVRRIMGRIIYGVVCFALLFSFTGTVLGGLWADDSWGRFWGWDPKENGALMIVLWNALVLHARWDKMIGDRGLAVLAIGGNIVTAWSWFGVNQLGIGLHSYGFTSGVAVALLMFGLSQLAAIVFGCLPTRLWWSYQTDGKVTPEMAA